MKQSPACRLNIASTGQYVHAGMGMGIVADARQKTKLDNLGTSFFPWPGGKCERVDRN